MHNLFLFGNQMTVLAATILSEQSLTLLSKTVSAFMLAGIVPIINVQLPWFVMLSVWLGSLLAVAAGWLRLLVVGRHNALVPKL